MMIEFSRMLEFIALFTRREPFYPKNLEPYVFNDWIVDFSKAQRELGFVPSTFAEGAQAEKDLGGLPSAVISASPADPTAPTSGRSSRPEPPI
jgi:hypothetical protein